MRLIDADALLTELHQYDDNCEFKNEFEYGLQQRLDTCIDAVEDAPTVDAVPVIRCKNCIHWGKYPVSTVLPKYHKCGMATYKSTKGDDFCSDGKDDDNG